MKIRPYANADQADVVALWQGQGHAKALIAQGEVLLLAAGCPKISLLVRRSNTQVLGFYEALGYGQDDVVSLGKRLIPDH